VGLAPDTDRGGILDGHVDPRPIMDVGVMNATFRASLLAIDEDDEYFLTPHERGPSHAPGLVRTAHRFTSTAIPTLRRSTTVCRMPSVAINIRRSFTYYYWRPTLEPTSGIATSLPRHLQDGHGRDKFMSVRVRIEFPPARLWLAALTTQPAATCARGL